MKTGFAGMGIVLLERGSILLIIREEELIMWEGYSLNPGEGLPTGLFIELYSDINVFQPGYSELLLDKKFHGYAGLKDYSFAKYINGEIVLRTGEFPYDKTDFNYVEENSDYKIFKHEGFKHVLYKNSNSTVLISRPELKTEDIIISFAYLFAFILLFVNLLLLI